MGIVNVIGYAGSEQKIEIFRTEIFLSAFTQTHIHQGDEVSLSSVHSTGVLLMSLSAVIWFSSYDFHGKQIRLTPLSYIDIC